MMTRLLDKDKLLKHLNEMITINQEGCEVDHLIENECIENIVQLIKSDKFEVSPIVTNKTNESPDIELVIKIKETIIDKIQEDTWDADDCLKYGGAILGHSWLAEIIDEYNGEGE